MRPFFEERMSMEIYRQVCDGVYRIPGSRSNIYLVTAPEPVLIDTGMPGDDQVILQAMRELGLAPRDLRAIFITHAHLDHIGSLAAVKAATGATIIAGVQEQDYIEGRRMLCSMRREGLAGTIFKCILFVLEKFVQKYSPVRLDAPFSAHEGSAPVCGVEIIATPGHSLGSLSFYLQAHRALFTGDALTGMPEPRLPLRAGCSDYGSALESVQRLAARDADICLFGHGEPLAGGAAAVLRKLAQQARL
jgi:glyoxylase-like metal-dependent hydrolase (beta-lactamase superfamily II)